MCLRASPRAREGAVFCDALRPFDGIAKIGALTPRRGRGRAQIFARPSDTLRASPKSVPSRLAEGASGRRVLRGPQAHCGHCNNLCSHALPRAREGAMFCDALRLLEAIANKKTLPSRIAEGAGASLRASQNIGVLTPRRGHVRAPCSAMPPGPLRASPKKNGALTPRRGRVRVQCFAIPSGPLRVSQTSVPSRLAEGRGELTPPG